MKNYLIPANTKKSRLWFGLFEPLDAGIFILGIAITLFIFLVAPVDNSFIAILALLPVLIGGFLVTPVPNYHNMRTLIKIAIAFYQNPRKYRWKGWRDNGKR